MKWLQSFSLLVLRLKPRLNILFIAIVDFFYSTSITNCHWYGSLGNRLWDAHSRHLLKGALGNHTGNSWGKDNWAGGRVELRCSWTEIQLLLAVLWEYQSWNSFSYWLHLCTRQRDFIILESNQSIGVGSSGVGDVALGKVSLFCQWHFWRGIPLKSAIC